jgi:hypothetical protein
MCQVRSRSDVREVTSEVVFSDMISQLFVVPRVQEHQESLRKDSLASSVWWELAQTVTSGEFLSQGP